MSLRSLIVRIWWYMSRLEVGSSSIRSSGSCARPLAIITLWCWPAESSLKFLMANSAMCIFSRQSAAISRSSSVSAYPEWGYLPMRTVSMTVMANVSPDACGT